MTESIRKTIPDIVKMLWNLENELRGAAQNSVFMRPEEARQHLSAARQHLDDLLGMARSPNSEAPTARISNSSVISKVDNNQL